MQMPSAIEKAYVDQGYRLPAKFTWDDVEWRRAAWDINAVLVSAGFVSGLHCLGRSLH
jgi:hypothetical protein